MDSGLVKCWGDNSAGQLGDGTTTSSAIPVDVVGLTDAIAVAVGAEMTCALTRAGGVKCWGWNLVGQLGNGTTTDSAMPVDVIGLSTGVVAIASSSGGTSNCAITAVGGVKCWGKNDYGQVGDGTTSMRTTPVDASGLTGGVIAVSLGQFHTCALTSAGGVKCWGRNENLQVGDGTDTQRLTPVDVSGLTDGVVAISVGSQHSCALTNGGGVKCWGYGAHGELGDGTAGIDRSTPVDVIGLTSGVTEIAAGGYHTCALTRDGTKCWGDNAAGQLGDGTTTSRTTPVAVVGYEPPVSLVATVGSPIAYPGDPVSFFLGIQNASNLYAAQASCSVNPSVLAPQTAIFGDFFDPVNRQIGTNQADAGAGAWLGAISQRNPAGPLSGNGLFATVGYTAVSPGMTTISCTPLFSDRNGLALASSFLPVGGVTVLSFASISGTARYQGRMAHAGIEVCSCGRCVRTDSGGAFTVGQLRAGTCDVTADGALYLPNRKAGVLLTPGVVVAIGATTLKGGDASKDVIINIGDASLVAANFGLPVPPADPRADINGDGVVNVLDLAILAGNYGLSGPLPW